MRYAPVISGWWRMGLRPSVRAQAYAGAPVKSRVPTGWLGHFFHAPIRPCASFEGSCYPCVSGHLEVATCLLEGPRLDTAAGWCQRIHSDSPRDRTELHEPRLPGVLRVMAPSSPTASASRATHASLDLQKATGCLRAPAGRDGITAAHAGQPVGLALRIGRRRCEPRAEGSELD